MDADQLANLIQRAKAEDQRAFALLFDHYWSYVYGFLFKQMNHPMVAEELSLQTFAKAFDRLETFDTSLNFNTWLISISKNTQRDYLKNKHTRAQAQFTSIEKENFTDLRDQNASPEDELIIHQNLHELLRQIKQLKPQYAKIIRLRYFEELSYKAIAAETHTPINTVKVMLLRAKKLLAEQILKQP